MQVRIPLITVLQRLHVIIKVLFIQRSCCKRPICLNICLNIFIMRLFSRLLVHAVGPFIVRSAIHSTSVAISSINNVNSISINTDVIVVVVVVVIVIIVIIVIIIIISIMVIMVMGVALPLNGGRREDGPWESNALFTCKDLVINAPHGKVFDLDGAKGIGVNGQLLNIGVVQWLWPQVHLDQGLQLILGQREALSVRHVIVAVVFTIVVVVIILAIDKGWGA